MSEEIEQAEKEVLARGYALQSLVNSEGWKVILGWYEERLQGFMTEVLVSDKPITEFENRKNKLAGIRELLKEVDSAITEYGELAKE